MKGSFWRRILEILILVAIGWYIVATLRTSWPVVVSHLSEARWSLLVAAWPCFFGYFILRGLAWHKLVVSPTEQALPTDSVRTWVTSELARYLPGNVWSFLGRVYLAGKQGIAKERASLGLIAEVLLLVATAAILSGGFFINLPENFNPAIRWLGLLCLPALGLIFWPRLLTQTVSFLMKRLKREVSAVHIAHHQLLTASLLLGLAWISYGYGSYLVALAFVSSFTGTVAWYVSVFIAAWLVGYLSFVTPMGLGVREGLVAALLAPAIGAPLATLVAIASRLWLIVSELSSFAIITLLTRWKPFTRRVNDSRWWKEYWPELTLGLTITAFILYFGVYTSLRHEHFITARFDLGIMDQVVWNTAQGRFLELTMPTGAITVSRFYIHADPLLALFAPLYKIVASAHILLWGQVLVVALGALPLYWLGREVTKSKVLALFVALGYLFFGPLQRAIIFDFHSVTLASSFIAFAFYFAYKRKYLPFVIFSLLVLSTKETMTFLVAGLGLYIGFKHKDWRFASLVIGASLLWFYLLLWQIMPHARGNGTTHFALGYYGYLGDSPGEILKNLILQPQRWLHVLLRFDQALYLLYFFGPTAFLPLFSPVILLALPEFAINMLSTQPEMHAIIYQYTSAITPFVFISTIFGLSYWQRRLATRYAKQEQKANPTRVLAWTLATTTILGIFAMSPLPLFRFADTRAFSYSFPGEADLRRLEKLIPTEASVAATNKLAPHFSHRENIYPIREGHAIADWVIIELYQKHENLTAKQVQQMMQSLPYDRVLMNGAIVAYRRK